MVVDMEAQDHEQFRFYPVAKVSDVPNGERLFIEVDEEPVVIFNIGGEYFAIADVCTHDDGPLGKGELEGYEVVCPRHGARFDIRTGGTLTLPAVVDIRIFQIRVSGDTIEIRVEKA